MIALPDLRRLWRSGTVAGIGVGVFVAICWVVWTSWGRAAMFAMLVACLAPILVLFEFPVLGAGVIAFVTTSSFETFVPAAFHASLVLTFAVLVARKVFRRDYTWRVPPFVSWCLLFYAWIALSILWAPGTDYIWSLQLWPSVFLMAVLPELIRDPKQYRFFLVALGLGIMFTAVSSLFGLYELFTKGLAVQAAGSLEGLTTARYFGHWRGANPLAHSLMPFAALYIPYLEKSENRRMRCFAALTLFLAVLAVALTLSRAGIIALTFALTVTAAGSRYRWRLAGAAVAALLCVVLFFPVGLVGRLSTLSSSSRDASISQRTEIARFSVQMALDAFPLGMGRGGFYTRQQDYHVVPYSVSDPHNTYLKVFVEQGIVGAMLFLTTIFSSFLSLRRARARPDRFSVSSQTRLALSATFIAMLFGMGFESLIGFDPYWIAFTLMSIYPHVFSAPDTIYESS